MSSPLYIKAMRGYFPEANNLEEFWKLIVEGRKTKTQSLSTYWGLDPMVYKDPKTDGVILQDLAHLVSLPSQDLHYPRQIQGAIDVCRELKNHLKTNKVGLVIACEWTDASYYQAELGLIKKELGYSLDRQLETIQQSIGIQGPALAVDTACASSLYAIEVARGLLSQECQEVIVLGLNLSLHSFLYRGFTKLGALSQKGELNSFDKNADGIVLGEAVCGVIVSHDHTDALAKISAIGLSCDGNEGSAFSPGFNGQLHAYERAYRDTSIKPQDVDYIEAHGTATVLGDETECRSIYQFFRPQSEKTLPIGSLKANIGHTLAASGLASLIKSVLIIQNQTLPPHIPIREREDLQKLNLEIIKCPKILTHKIITIGLSSFGFGGSNAHIVVTSASGPEESKQEGKTGNASFYIQSLASLDAHQLSQAPPILKNVAMGPKMQERIDPLQRWGMYLIQELTGHIPISQRNKMSCVAVNNLGGTLSLDFEKKYHQGLQQPELSIEAIASTLPSMMSGHPSILFDFQGHHLTLSGDKKCFIETLKLIPHLLDTAQGDLILLTAYQNPHNKNHSFMLAMRISQEKNQDSITQIVLKSSQGLSSLEDYGEARGAMEFYQFVQHKHKLIKLDELEITQTPFTHNPSELMQKILNQSQQNKQIALDYLNLLSFLKADHTHEAKVGEYLVHCEKTTHSASAQLLVDETQTYFFDHPLDHIPGILSIHACEELLRWFMSSPYLIVAMTIRFTKFLEKNKAVDIKLEQRQSGSIEFEISQDKIKAGILKIDLKPLNAYAFTNPSSKMMFTIEDQKYTHKKRVENVLVSSLDKHNQSCWALPLSVNQGPFFYQLESPSALYYAEVTRQFVMLLAHLVKDIPLSSKMNLIASEINLVQWVKPPYMLKLQSFKLTETEDFLVADVVVDFLLDERVFGQGKIKAQVVSLEYYGQQRGEK